MEDEKDDDILYYFIRDAPEEKQFHLLEMNDYEVLNYDGPHSDVESVVTAKKIMQHIFGKSSSYFVMVTTEPVPDIDVDINNEAADNLAAIIDWSEGRMSEREIEESAI